MTNANFLPKISFIFFLMLFSIFTYAQADKEYKAANEGWLVNLDEAYALSKKTGKPIVANFTGTDWCPYCVKFSKNVFVKKDFIKWAAENVILLELDFPKRFELPAEIKSQNSSLQQAFKVTGYPTIWVFDLDKDTESNQYSITALGMTRYTPSPDQFISDLESMLERREK